MVFGWCHKCLAEMPNSTRQRAIVVAAAAATTYRRFMATRLDKQQLTKPHRKSFCKWINENLSEREEKEKLAGNKVRTSHWQRRNLASPPAAKNSIHRWRCHRVKIKCGTRNSLALKGIKRRARCLLTNITTAVCRTNFLRPRISSAREREREKKKQIGKTAHATLERRRFIAFCVCFRLVWAVASHRM